MVQLELETYTQAWNLLDSASFMYRTICLEIVSVDVRSLLNCPTTATMNIWLALVNVGTTEVYSACTAFKNIEACPDTRLHRQYSKRLECSWAVLTDVTTC
jgi:hypothetical protein